MNRRTLKMKDRMDLCDYIRKNYETFCKDGLNIVQIARNVSTNIGFEVTPTNVSTILKGMGLRNPFVIARYEAIGHNGPVEKRPVNSATPFALRIKQQKEALENAYTEIDGLRAQVEYLTSTVEHLCKELDVDMPIQENRQRVKAGELKKFMRIQSQ